MAKVPLDGHGPSQTLLTLTHAAFSLDIGPDGGIYLDQNDRPVDLVRFPAEGGHVERIATMAQTGDTNALDSFAVLPDGRAAWIELTSGRTRLTVLEAGKDPVPLVNTNEEIAGPLTAVGASEVAF